MNNVDDDDQFFSNEERGDGGKKFLRSFNQFRKRNHRHEYSNSINQIALKFLLFAFLHVSFISMILAMISRLYSFSFQSLMDVLGNLCTSTLAGDFGWNLREFWKLSNV